MQKLAHRKHEVTFFVQMWFMSTYPHVCEYKNTYPHLRLKKIAVIAVIFYFRAKLAKLLYPAL